MRCFRVRNSACWGCCSASQGEVFFATELIALAGSGSGAVQRELKRLNGSGLVTLTRVGNQCHYQANPDSPLFAALHDIVIKTSGLAEPIRSALSPLADKVLAACVFGSWRPAHTRPAVTLM